MIKLVFFLFALTILIPIVFGIDDSSKNISLPSYDKGCVSGYKTVIEYSYDESGSRESITYEKPLKSLNNFSSLVNLNIFKYNINVDFKQSEVDIDFAFNKPKDSFDTYEIFIYYIKGSQTIKEIKLDQNIVSNTNYEDTLICPPFESCCFNNLSTRLFDIKGRSLNVPNDEEVHNLKYSIENAFNNEKDTDYMGEIAVYFPVKNIILHDFSISLPEGYKGNASILTEHPNSIIYKDNMSLINLGSTYPRNFSSSRELTMNGKLIKLGLMPDTTLEIKDYPLINTKIMFFKYKFSFFNWIILFLLSFLTSIIIIGHLLSDRTIFVRSYSLLLFVLDSIMIYVNFDFIKFLIDYRLIEIFTNISLAIFFSILLLKKFKYI